jgi:hypothetical protein
LQRKVIRCGLGQRKNQGHGELRSPSNISEKPVNLLQKRRILHIAPGVASTLNGQLNKTQMADNIVKHKTIIVITTWFVSIFRESVKIKISHE